jgi:hypothetical protein
VAISLTAYASDTQYRARVKDAATGTDATLNSQLLLGSRLLERSLNVMPGAFNSQSAETFTFDSFGGRVLPLRDREGRQYFLRTTTSIGIDTELDGTYDGEVIDLEDDVFVRGIPESALAFGQPFTALELLPFSGATVSVWPDRVASVRIAGAWGWAAVPEAIVDLVVHIVHDLRMAHAAGAAFEVPDIDQGGLPLSRATFAMWERMKGSYARRLPI